ncbi:IS110 family transposase [Asanoa iriomotensis]|uniref:IS110 family transposase n=2 Tax=Asanoa iriomotensis TaxID=234613 RepID=A0ABQ4CGQ9_9ACTN|nr:IS110 family transposase [Asanoa iriomotensis]
MAKVVIGVDPHKRSATIEVIGGSERVLGGGRYGTDRAGYKAMLAAGRVHVDRVWAVEGCSGIGRHVAQRLVADGETVVDVPSKSSARTRAFATGNGRKSDPADAHHIAVTALRTPGLHVVRVEDHTTVLRLLVDRREQLARTRTETVNRLHALLLDLIPGGAKRSLSTGQARTLLADIDVVAGDIAAATRRRLAGELVDELTVLDTKIKTATAELATVVEATGSRLQQLRGIGPCSAARLLADIGDIARFADPGHFASWNGTAPLDASSGDNNRHRLNRTGNRRINRVLHIMAIAQIRHNSEGRVYYHAKLAAGKTRMEAIRALKRRLSDIVHRQMIHDATTTRTGPGGHTGATLTPARPTKPQDRHFGQVTTRTHQTTP